MGIRKIISFIILAIFLLLIIPEQTIHDAPYSEKLGLIKTQQYVKTQANSIKENVTQDGPQWIEKAMKSVMSYAFELFKEEAQEQLFPEGDTTNQVPEVTDSE